MEMAKRITQNGTDRVKTATMEVRMTVSITGNETKIPARRCGRMAFMAFNASAGPFQRHSCG